MLIQFCVSNFRSIKDLVTLNTLAGTGKEHNEILLKYNKTNVLPTISMYGANGAGKSSIILAMKTAINLIKNSNNMQVNGFIPDIVPFAFDEESKKQPTEFEFAFVTNETKYIYGFSADSKKIYEEYLYVYKSSRKSLIFERSETDKYKFARNLKPELSLYTSKNTDNKLFLATATSWNCKHTKEAYMWLAEYISVYEKRNFNPEVLPVEMLEKDKEEISETIKFITKMMHKADINISDFSIRTKEMSPEEFIKTFPNGVSIPFPIPELLAPESIVQYEMETTHKVSDNKEYKIPFMWESDGTKALLNYGVVLKEALEKGKTIVVDELDNSLHTLILEMLIKIFHDKNINKNGAQLIFNSHDVALMELDLFRRDQIYFVEKDYLTGRTDLYSLYDFTPRKDDNIRKGYMLGKYGAIPVVGGEDINW